MTGDDALLYALGIIWTGLSAVWGFIGSILEDFDKPVKVWHLCLLYFLLTSRRNKAPPS